MQYVAADELSPTLQRFIIDHISSVDQLETLLLLYRNPLTDFTAEEVSARLYTTPEAARTRLEDLRGRALVSQVDTKKTYRFAPLSNEAVAVVDALAKAYKERPVSVITLIYSKPPANLQAFSDAFRLRKKEDK